MVLASGAVGAALAVGLAALFGSRGPVIGILIAAHLVFEPQLQGAGFLGDARQALPISAINRLGDAGGGLDYRIALGTADRRHPRVDRRRPRGRRMAHQDARDLMAQQGRGYAQRVSPALPSWLRPPWARTVDVLVVLAVFVLVVPATIAEAARTDEVCSGRRCWRSSAVLALLWRRRAAVPRARRRHRGRPSSCRSTAPTGSR